MAAHTRRHKPASRIGTLGVIMLNRFARAFVTRLLTPVARLFLKLGISPDVVTIVGTLGVCIGALAFRSFDQVGRLPGLHPGPGR